MFTVVLVVKGESLRRGQIRSKLGHELWRQIERLSATPDGPSTIVRLRFPQSVRNDVRNVLNEWYTEDGQPPFPEGSLLFFNLVPPMDAAG